MCAIVFGPGVKTSGQPWPGMGSVAFGMVPLYENPVAEVREITHSLPLGGSDVVTRRAAFPARHREGSIMALQFNRLSEQLGAEVLGLDLHQEIDEETADMLRQAILDHDLLLFRDQPLEPGEHKRFCELFGEIQAQRLAADLESKDYVGMMFVSNVHEDGMLRDGDMWLHSDQCYYDKPNKMTSLQAIKIPRRGGNTRFANCRLAYEALPDDTKTHIDGLQGMNIYDYEYNEENAQKKSIPRDPEAPRYAHPIVRTHPETGKKSLYLNRLMTDYIVDMDAAESRDLLGQLIDHVEDDRFIYEHRWREGDIAIWDNRTLLHGRTDFDPSEERHLRRFCVIGDEPY